MTKATKSKKTGKIEGSESQAETVERIGVLVVHGVGEQSHYEHLEGTASNFVKALRRDRERPPHVQLLTRAGGDSGGSALDGSSTRAIVSWRRPGDGTRMQVHYREVFWADLDERVSVWRWMKLVGWALAMPGIRVFDKAKSESGVLPDMVPPKALSFGAWIVVRAQLLLTALLFFLMLISVDLLYWLLTRLSFKATWIGALRELIYDYLGDVKLYQDWVTRKDDRVEVVGEKSRVAIRRRMVRALVAMARDVTEGRLDGFYVVAHSLGTVVAFNALMEHGHRLPNYLTEEEWNNLPGPYQHEMSGIEDVNASPRRPPWLGPDAAIDRAALFAGLRGVLTLGSPLNKFAALWPAIVPANGEPIPGKRPWINVADIQDIVAGKVSLWCENESACVVGGLAVTNVEWADQWTLATAHTHYWWAGASGDRLIDRLVPWFEGKPFERPRDRLRPWAARVIYWALLAILGLIPLVGMAYLIWLLRHAGDLLQVLTQAALNKQALAAWMTDIWKVMTAIDWWTLIRRGAVIFVTGIVIVGGFALIRRGWEWLKFGDKPGPKKASS